MLDRISHLMFGYLDIIPIILSSILMLYVTYIICKLIGHILMKMLPKKMAPELKSFTTSAAQVFAFLLGASVTMRIVGVEAGNLMAMLGLSTIAIGMSFKDVFVNTIQGAMILVHHPFKIGDTLTIGETSGTVTKIGLMHTQVETEDSIKLIPNSKMYAEVVEIKK